MGFNILSCDQACTDCVKSYKKKHDLKPGDSFKIACEGIPKEYLSPSFLEGIDASDVQDYLSTFDPVTWAASMLDWHCKDPQGEIWKRKTLENTLGDVTPYLEDKYSELIKNGKSAFNRPYQAIMLRCTAKLKVFRIGRQAGKTESICVSILHNIFTKKDFRVIVITPYQTQIEVIFNRLSSLIKNAPKLNGSIKRYVKAPNYTIELHNGSTIKGFTAGTKSGGNADAVRGQKANMLVFDEADYLSPEDMASALAVIQNYPDATVWMSSTPTGKRERFYDACKSSIWKEYYFPSMVNPLWNEEREEFFKNEYTEIQYTHEILADFGEQEQGVYQSVLVEDAMVDYKYEDRRLDGWYYTFGVDWNDQKVGTTIAVVGYNPALHKMKLFNRYTVSKEGWTQLTAIEKIIELNAYWEPVSIYVDKGYGGTQFEVIKRYGADSLANRDKGPRHPDSRLHRITKQYDFGSKITIKDPATRQDVDKAAKPFLVENSVRRFEQRMFEFSKYDAQLEAELRGYIIDHTTVSGSPVYKQGNEKAGDHNLDALNLALLAFTLEGSEFGKVKFDSHIAFSPGFGQKPPQQLTFQGKMETNQGMEAQKPSMNRTENIGNQTFGSEKSAGVRTGDAPRKLWAWPGFDKDSPKPNRSITGGLSGRRPGPPSRKKI